MSPITGKPAPTKNPVFNDSELVLGLVAPVGTNFDRFQHSIDRILKKFGYASNEVRLSNLTENFKHEELPEDTKLSIEAARLRRRMHAGNLLRFESGKGDFLALAAAQAIRQSRPNGEVRPKIAHVIRSLKHPDEVRTLRRIYGSGFYLLGVTVDEKERQEYLEKDKGCTAQEASDLLQRDEHEEDPHFIDADGQNYGQQTRDTFHLADVFISLKEEAQLERFLNLVFGCHTETPSQDEYAMFLAFGAALRSGDLSRQVGAVLMTAQGDVVAVGANDVPCAGGGLYWPGDGDQRDHVRGVDSNEDQRRAILKEVLDRLKPENMPEAEWHANGEKRLKGSRLMDITEYGRAVHAEMETLLACARSGVSTRGCILYSTTFPCHNCAKHIIAAGVSRVVYVEPYPKSQAKVLFDDSILFGPNQSQKTNAVRFESFVGLGPRRFFDLFSLGLSSGTVVKRKESGKLKPWSPTTGRIRVPLLPNSYLERELAAEQELLELTET